MEKVDEIMQAEQARMADAVGQAMARPGREVTAYSRADRETLKGDAARLRARAQRLELLAGQVAG